MTSCMPLNCSLGPLIKKLAPKTSCPQVKFSGWNTDNIETWGVVMPGEIDVCPSQGACKDTV